MYLQFFVLLFNLQLKYLILIVLIVARDLPGGKRILAINMMAQHITFSKVIKPVEVQINFY